MFGKKIKFEIISALSLSWGADAAYAKPRSFHALSYRKKGEAEFIHGEKTFKVSEGEIIFVPKNYDYTIKPLKNEEVAVVHFDSDDESLNEIEVFRPVHSEVFSDLFSKIYETWLNKPVGYEFRLDSLFLRILENVAVQTYGKLYDMEKKFASLLDYARQEFRNPSLTVERLSKELGVSGTYLRKLFKEKTGTTPHKYIDALRVDYATALLSSGYYTVAEAAYAAGFSDPKYFSVVYKKAKGLSPRDEKRK